MKKLILITLLLLPFLPLPAQDYPEMLSIRLFRQQWKKDAAIEALDELREKYPNDPNLLYLRAQLMLDFSEFQEAAEDFRDLLGLKLPKTLRSDVISSYAATLGCQGDTAGMKEFILEEIPKGNKNLFHQGVAAFYLITAGYLNEAQEYLDHILSKDPDNSEANYWKGVIELQKSGEGAGVKYFKKNYELEVKSGKIALAMFSIFFSGAKNQALEWMKELRDASAYPLYQVNYAVLLCMAGKNEESIDELKKYWKDRQGELYFYFRYTRDLDPIRSHPEFQKLYQQIFPEN